MGSKKAKKEEKEVRYILLIKVRREGEKDGAYMGTMKTDSLRAARYKFRRQIRDFLRPTEISAAELRPIVADGYVMAAGPITPFANRLALMLVDNENPRFDRTRNTPARSLCCRSGGRRMRSVGSPICSWILSGALSP